MTSSNENRNFIPSFSFLKLFILSNLTLKKEQRLNMKSYFRNIRHGTNFGCYRKQLLRENFLTPILGSFSKLIELMLHVRMKKILKITDLEWLINVWLNIIINVKCTCYYIKLYIILSPLNMFKSQIRQALKI